MMLAGTLNADLSRQEDEELDRLRQLRSEMEVEEHLLLDMNTSTRFASMRVARTAPAPITSPTRSVDGPVPSTDDAESFEVTIRKKILLDRLITSSLKRQRITLAFAKELSAMPVDEGLQRIQEHYSGGLFHLDPDNEDDEDFAEAQREALKIIGLRKALGDSQATSDSQPTAAAVVPVVVNRSPAIGSTAKQGANSRRTRQRRVELNAAEPANDSRHNSLSSSGRDRRYSTISDGFGSMQPYEGMSHAARAIKRASMASSALGGRPLSGDGGAAGGEGTALSLAAPHGAAGGSQQQNTPSAGRAATTRLFFTQVVEDRSTMQPAAEQRGTKTGSKASHRGGRKTSPHGTAHKNSSSAAPGDVAMRRMVMEGIKDSLVSHFTGLASVKGITVFDEDTALGTLDEKGIGMKGFIDFNGRGLGPDVQWPTTLQVGGWTFQVSHSGGDAVPALAFSTDAGVPLDPAVTRPTNDPPHREDAGSPGSGGGGTVESRPLSVTATSELASSLLRQVASGLSPPPERLTVSPRSGVGSPWGNESSSAIAVAPTSARVDVAATKGAARQRNGAGKAGAKKSVAPPSTAPVGSVRPRLGLVDSVVKRSEPTTTAHSSAADPSSLKSPREASAPSAPRPLPLTSAADWAKLPSIPRSFLAPPAMAGFLPHSELRCSTAAAAAVTARRPNTRGTATDGDFGWTASSTPRGLTSRGSNNTTASAAAAATTQGPFVVERFYSLLPRECADALMERRQASAEWAIQSAAHATVTIGREERAFVPRRPGVYTAAAASSQRPTSEQTPLVLQQTAWQSRSTASVVGAAPAVPSDLLLDGLVKQTPLSPRARRPPTNDRPHRL